MYSLGSCKPDAKTDLNCGSWIECSGQPTHVSKEAERICCTTSSNCNYEQQSRNSCIPIGPQNAADTQSIVSYQTIKPTNQRDHLGLQVPRQNETQTRPKRDPNDPTNNISPHTNGTAAHPTTQDPPHTSGWNLIWDVNPCKANVQVSVFVSVNEKSWERRGLQWI